jgi:hypothetical protein
MDCEFQTSRVSWSLDPPCRLSTMSYLLVPLKVLHHRLILRGTFYQQRTIYPPRSGNLVRPARGIMSRLVSSERAYQSTSKTACKRLWDPKLAHTVLWQNITQIKEYSFPGYNKVSVVVVKHLNPFSTRASNVGLFSLYLDFQRTCDCNTIIKSYFRW